MPVQKVTKLVNKASLQDFLCTPDENAEPSDTELRDCSMHGTLQGTVQAITSLDPQVQNM